MKPRLRLLCRVGLGLLLLLLAMVGMAFVDLGPFQLAFSLGVAGAMALFVLVYFMELGAGEPLLWLVAAAGFYWLGILFVLMLGDFLTRGWH